MKSLFTKARKAVLAGVAVATVATAVASPAHAQRAGNLNSMTGWTVLGTAVVADRGEEDRIRVRGSERFGEVKLCVVGHPMELYDWEVVFGNGRRQDIEARRRFNANTCTRAVNLRGRNDRNIDRVILRYESLRDRGRQPIVIVLGR